MTTTILYPKSNGLAVEEKSRKNVVRWNDFRFDGSETIVYDDDTNTIQMRVPTDKYQFTVSLKGKMLRRIGITYHPDNPFVPAVFGEVDAVALPVNWWQAVSIINTTTEEAYNLNAAVWDCPMGHALREKAKSVFTAVTRTTI